MVPSCAEGGVLGFARHGRLIQATECVKLIIGNGKPLIGRLLLYNALDMSFKELKIRRDPNCPVCGDKPTVTELSTTSSSAASAAAMRRPRLPPARRSTCRPQGLDGQEKEIVLVDVREPMNTRSPISAASSCPGTLAENINQLDSADEIVVHCKMGGRSARAQAVLNKFGFKKVYNLEGGIDAWSTQIDPSLPVLMKAIRFYAHGGPENLVYEDCEDPKPAGPALSTSRLAPSTAWTSGAPGHPRLSVALPHILGSDIAVWPSPVILRAAFRPGTGSWSILASPAAVQGLHHGL